MRALFPEYYRPTRDEFKQLWKNCMFVPDANVLLNLYRFTDKSRDELFDIFERLSDQLWLPYQVAFEYQKNRLTRIGEEPKAYEKLIQHLKTAKSQLETQERQFNTFKKGHRIPENIDPLITRVHRVLDKVEGELEKQKGSLPNWIHDDPIRDALDRLFEGKVGNPYPPKRLEDIYDNGAERYERNQPPGYADEKDKDGVNQFGDLVIWFQIVEQAKATQKPVIFITDDRKEDWWWIQEGKIIGPRRELVRELLQEADVRLYLYEPEQFITQAQSYLNVKVDDNTLEEVREVSEFSREVVQQGEEISRPPLRIRVPVDTNNTSKDFLRAVDAFIGQNAKSTADTLRLIDEMQGNTALEAVKAFAEIGLMNDIMETLRGLKYHDSAIGLASANALGEGGIRARTGRLAMSIAQAADYFHDLERVTSVAGVDENDLDFLDPATARAGLVDIERAADSSLVDIRPSSEDESPDGLDSSSSQPPE